MEFLKDLRQEKPEFVSFDFKDRDWRISPITGWALVNEPWETRAEFVCEGVEAISGWGISCEIANRETERYTPEDFALFDAFGQVLNNL